MTLQTLQCSRSYFPLFLLFSVPFKSILCCSPVDQHLSNKLSFKSNYFLDEFLWQSGCALTFHISFDDIHGLCYKQKKKKFIYINKTTKIIFNLK